MATSSPPLSFDHPRPLCRRPVWRSLDGPWDFAFDPEGDWHAPDEVRFDRQIEVPYAPETVRSGLADQDFHPTVWYRRQVVIAPEADRRTFLHFGAVDHEAQVWVNGQPVVRHVGAHTPFSAELTHLLPADGRVTVTLRAEDDPTALDQARGKQDWNLEPHSIWYPRTTGIWQTVWWEQVPTTFIRRVDWTAHLEDFALSVEVTLDGPLEPGDAVRVRLTARGACLVEDTYSLQGPSLRRRLHLPDGGLEHVRSELLWSPEHPQLIDAEVTLLRHGQEFDAVASYTALRTVGWEDGAFLLNGRPYGLRLVLDQGYWPEGGLTATPEELRRDVLLAKRLGFNGVRKHQKIEDPRYLRWCDALGLMVWEEMPSAYRFSPRTLEEVTAEWLEALVRDRSHPCIIAWVPFNESWGLPDLRANPQTQSFCRALYHLTKAADPTRPVVSNDGWEHFDTDLLTVHDYTDQASVLLARYGDASRIAHTLEHVRPERRRIVLGVRSAERLPVLITEFGGIAFALGKGEGWGYSRARDAAGFLARYTALLTAVNACEEVAGFCYTQFTDTYQEVNGLLTADREFKADPAVIAAQTRGPRSAVERDWDRDPHPLGYSREWVKTGVHPGAEDLFRDAKGRYGALAGALGEAEAGDAQLEVPVDRVLDDEHGGEVTSGASGETAADVP